MTTFTVWMIGTLGDNGFLPLKVSSDHEALDICMTVTCRFRFRSLEIV